MSRRPTPDSADTLREAALALFSEGDFSAAVDVIRGMVSLNVVSPEMYLLLAVCYEQLGESAAAKAAVAASKAVLLQVVQSGAVPPDAQDKVNKLITAAAGWFPGGAHHPDTRRALAYDANRWLPKSMKGDD